MRSFCWVLGVLTVAVFVETGRAQPRQAATPELEVGLLATTLGYLQDAQLQKELKLSEEQVKKLVEYRQKYWDDSFKQTPDELKKMAAERRKTTDKEFAAILKPEQVKRIREIALQQLGVTGTGRINILTFHRYPELVEALKLTEEQQETLKGGEVPTRLRGIVLNKEQQKTWASLIGEPFRAELVYATDTRIQAEGRTPPQDLRYLQTRMVRDEIKLTDEQARGVVPLMKKWATMPLEADLSVEEEQKKHQAAAREFDKAVVDLLKPEQVKRLRELRLQHLDQTSGFHALLTEAAVTESLKITDAQRAKLVDLVQAEKEELKKAFVSGEAFTVIEKAVAGIEQETRDKLRKVLTAEQQAALRKQLGEPFPGKIELAITGISQFGGFPGPGGPGGLASRYFGLYYLELGYLVQKPIQDELKLNEEQAKKAADAWKRWSERSSRERTTTGLAAISKDTATDLADILTPEQAKRFREIMLQVRAGAINGGSAATTRTRPPIAYPGVAEELKVTEDQREKLTKGEDTAEVLTAEQQKQLREIEGARFKGELFRPVLTSVAGRLQTQPSVAQLIFEVTQPNIVAALKITEEQMEKITAARQKYAEASREARMADNPTKALAAVYAETRKGIQAILSTEQFTRLEQIMLQSLARTSLARALRSEDMAKKLELTEEQAKKLAAIETDVQQTRRLMLTKLRPAAAPTNPARGNDDVLKILGLTDEQVKKFNTLTEEKSLKVLTEAQRARWKEVLGEPFRE
jgi:Spy/CpxP family protein refolding chaperone